MEIGLFLPIMLEESLPNLDRIDWERERQTVLESEEYGFESVGVSDHLQMGEGVNLEHFSVLSSLAEASERIKLVSLVTCVPFRNPALVAKSAATIDFISEGRFQLGIGAGWHRPEFEAYGYGFEDVKVRVDRLAESARLIRKVWREDEVDFDGKFYHLDGCVCRPKPADPYLIIGGNTERIQRLAERHADEWNFYGGYSEMLERASESERVKVSWFGPAVVSRDEEYMKKITNEAYPDRPSRYIKGTPEEFLEKLERMEDRGVDRVLFRLLDYPQKDSLHILRDEVIPEIC